MQDKSHRIPHSLSPPPPLSLSLSLSLLSFSPSHYPPSLSHTRTLSSLFLPPSPALSLLFLFSFCLSLSLPLLFSTLSLFLSPSPFLNSLSLSLSLVYVCVRQSYPRELDGWEKGNFKETISDKIHRSKSISLNLHKTKLSFLFTIETRQSISVFLISTQTSTCKLVRWKDHFELLLLPWLSSCVRLHGTLTAWLTYIVRAVKVQLVNYPLSSINHTRWKEKPTCTCRSTVLLIGGNL